MLRQIKELSVKKSSLLSLLLLYLFILLIFSSIMVPSGVSGWISEDDKIMDDEDDDGLDDEIEDLNERTLQIEVEEDQVEIQSELKNGTTNDKINIIFKSSGGPEFRLEYQSESDSDEIELSFDVQFFSIIEFIDTNGNNVLDEGEEIQEYELETDFTPISYNIRNDGFGYEIHTFNTTSEDGVFSLQFYVFTNISSLNGGIVVPSEIKMDLAIRDYPFLESTSKLALYTQLEAESEFEIDDQTEDEEHNRTSDEKEVDVTVGNFTGFFSWYEYALVDGINKTVYHSNVESDESDKEKIFLIYENGSRIIHDPKIGFENITKLELPFIPPEIIPSILSVLALPDDKYLLAVIILTTIMVPSAWLLYRKNQV
ncbi:hypothetical protein CEE45_02285 [Candidatus Heimdallarchaeota archaeon B3_Heim]|nr:MAG: hypothetical protein CEE45_02285 [Candidatus Heimdallarchaeota archaeon B3_Heim]